MNTNGGGQHTLLTGCRAPCADGLELQCLFLPQETVPTFTKEAGGTMPVHTLTSTECGTEEAITEASTKMEFSGLNTEAGHTP